MMLEKNSNSTDKYKLNNRTSLIVKNDRIEDDRGQVSYKAAVTLKHNITRDEPLTFSDPDEISDFVNNIEMDSEQLSLIGK